MCGWQKDGSRKAKNLRKDAHIAEISYDPLVAHSAFRHHPPSSSTISTFSQHDGGQLSSFPGEKSVAPLLLMYPTLSDWCIGVTARAGMQIHQMIMARVSCPLAMWSRQHCQWSPHICCQHATVVFPVPKQSFIDLYHHIQKLSSYHLTLHLVHSKYISSLALEIVNILPRLLLFNSANSISWYFVFRKNCYPKYRGCPIFYILLYLLML